MSNETEIYIPPQDPSIWLNFNPPSDKTGRTNNNYTRFFIIAVVSLSVVVSLVMLMHLYLRYARRRHINQYRRRSRANLLRLATFSNDTVVPRSETPRGLDRAAVSSIRSFQYSNRSDNTEDSNGSVRAEDCSVCLSVLEEGDVVRMLPNCRHVFHVGCIDKWLFASASCPVCRAEVKPGEQSVSVGLADVTEAKGIEEEASVSARLSSSFRRMLSRERSSSRRVVGDLERGSEVNSS